MKDSWWKIEKTEPEVQSFNPTCASFWKPVAYITQNAMQPPSLLVAMLSASLEKKAGVLN